MVCRDDAPVVLPLATLPRLNGNANERIRIGHLAKEDWNVRV
jgi:hypothetical protein